MRLVSFAASIAVLSGSHVQATQAADTNPKAYSFGLTVEMVHLGVTAMKKGRIVTDLKQKDFEVYEDGALQKVEYFSKGTDAPVDVFLLVDASGSMDIVEKVASARNTAIQLIQSLDLEDRVAVYGFDKDLIPLAEFTEDKEKAIKALDELEIFGTTAIHDAVAKASALIADAGFGRRAIVLITDGVDTSSQLTAAEAVDVAKRVDVPLYVVRVVSPIDDPAHDLFVGEEKKQEQGPGEDALRLFAEETGGRLYTGSEIGALHQISVQIREELKTQYRLSYVPRNSVRDGRFRKVDVRTSRKGVEARTRKGYYTRPVRRTERSHRPGESNSSSQP